MFLEFPISTSNLPKSLKMYQIANRYWPNRQPVLAKSPTGILTNLTIHTFKLCISFLPTFWNCQPVLIKLPTRSLVQWLVISSIPVVDLANTGWRIGQYRLAISPIPVGELANTGWRIGQYRLANWSIPVGELANTGWRFQNVGDGTFWTSLPLPYEDIYFQSCLANYLSVEGSISFWKKAYLDVHMYLNGQKGS